jgi:hypothetical protein
MRTKKLENHETEIITVLNEQIPTGSQNESDQFRLKAEYLLNTLKLQIENRTNHSQTACCRHLPHEYFFVIEHYLDDVVVLTTSDTNTNT